MSVELYGELHGAREHLCRAQTGLADEEHRRLLQEAIDRIDLVGATLPEWSRFDRPEVIDVRDPAPAAGWLNPPGR